MEAAWYIVIGIMVVLALVLKRGDDYKEQPRDFDDPQPMTNEHLLSAIAGQADWLEKMNKSPLESQRSAPIVELTSKRKNYISLLFLEVISRGNKDDDVAPKYPEATKSLNVFSETAENASELENTNISRNNAAVRAIKEKLFATNGASYISNWEI